LARYSRLPVIGKLIDWYLFRGNKLYFLPQDRVIDINQSIETPSNTVLPSQIVEFFIRKAKYRWIMNRCVCRDGNQCQDYPIDLGCIFLGEATTQIHPELGKQVSVDEALKHLDRCREAGLIQMIGRDRLDAVVLGIGPGEKLMTICNCCQCCCLWRIIPIADDRIASKVMKVPGVTVTVNEGCDGCEICTENVCFVDAVYMAQGRATITEECRGCGRCIEACPNGSIELVIENPEFVSAAIENLSSLVDLS